MLYCDYDTYSAMGGTMSAEQYGLWGPRASRKIDELTLGRAEGHAADLKTDTAKAMPPLAPPDAPLPVRCMISCPILLAQTLTGCCTGGVADAWRRQNRNYNPFRLRQRHRYRYRNHAHAERVQLVRKEQSVCRCILCACINAASRRKLFPAPLWRSLPATRSPAEISQPRCSTGMTTAAVHLHTGMWRRADAHRI